MISRRRLIIASLCLLPLRLVAFPLDRVLGLPPDSFVKEYVQRYWRWYQKQWFKFTDVMSETEQQLFSHWLEKLPSFGQKMYADQYIENFLTRHFLHNNAREHGTYYCGLPLWSTASLELFKKLSKEKAPHLSDKFFQSHSLYGWSHDLENKLFKIWFRADQPEEFLKTHSKGIPQLGFIEFNKGQEKRRGLVLSVEKEDITFPPEVNKKLVISVFKVVDSNGKASLKFRTRGTFLPGLQKGILWIAAKHREEFRHTADFIEPGNKSLKVYYP